MMILDTWQRSNDDDHVQVGYFKMNANFFFQKIQNKNPKRE